MLDLEIEAELAFEATKGKQHLSRSFLHAARLAGPVSGDPNRLQQVVWNLLSNAIKFAPKGGRVRVALERVNSHVEVCVSDTGEGISPEVLPHVFERFRQGHGATTRRHGGVGLGLSIGEAPGRTARRDGAGQESGEGQGSTFRSPCPTSRFVPRTTTTGRSGGTREPAGRPRPSAAKHQT